MYVLSAEISESFQLDKKLALCWTLLAQLKKKSLSLWGRGNPHFYFVKLILTFFFYFIEKLCYDRNLPPHNYYYSISIFTILSEFIVIVDLDFSFSVHYILVSHVNWQSLEKYIPGDLNRTSTLSSSFPNSVFHLITIL